MRAWSSVSDSVKASSLPPGRSRARRQPPSGAALAHLVCFAVANLGDVYQRRPDANPGHFHRHRHRFCLLARAQACG